MIYKALSIAGFDGSGGAGLQADLKTFSAFGCYGMTVLTALPVQNTQGVRSCYDIPLAAIREQLEAVVGDIRPDAIKIGMLFNSAIVELVADFLRGHAQGIPVILDPVMMAKSGDALLLPEAVNSLKAHLVPLTSVMTPNLPEAQVLCGKLAATREEMPEVAALLLEFGPQAVLLKGGHFATGDSPDFYADKTGRTQWLEGERIHTKNTHGTGCTLSAAIAACIAQGMKPPDACMLAKHYLHEALSAAKDQRIGQGQGPVHHFYHLWPSIGKIMEASGI